MAAYPSLSWIMWEARCGYTYGHPSGVRLLKEWVRDPIQANVVKPGPYYLWNTAGLGSLQRSYQGEWIGAASEGGWVAGTRTTCICRPISLHPSEKTIYSWNDIPLTCNLDIDVCSGRAYCADAAALVSRVAPLCLHPGETGEPGIIFCTCHFDFILTWMI